MADGSRHFAELPESREAGALRDHLAGLSGASLTGFLGDDLTETWIDFHYRGHDFSINDQLGSWWFFVADPLCPEALLDEVTAHFGALLDPSR